MIDSHEPNVYQRVQADHVQAMLQLRYHPAESERIQRMLRDRIIKQNSPSEIISISTEAAERALVRPRSPHFGAGTVLPPAVPAPLPSTYSDAAAGHCPVRLPPHSSPSGKRIKESDMSDTTRPVPSSADGSYIRPPSAQQQIAEKLKRMPKVDAQGHDLLPADPDPDPVAPIVDPAEPQAMKPNPLQGGGGGVSVPAPASGSVLERLAQQLADGDEPEIPAAYTPASPR